MRVKKSAFDVLTCVYDHIQQEYQRKKEQMMEQSEKVLMKQAVDFNYYYIKQIAAK